jgi:branched-chain amino acid transport system ATP-binding protein
MVGALNPEPGEIKASDRPGTALGGENREMAGETILEVRNLTKRFGALTAVDHVSIPFPKGKITLIIGPNGSGKTTLLNCIAGLYQPDEGQVIYKGEDITGYPSHEIARKGLVRTFQIPLPLSKLTVLENLLVGYQHNPGERLFRSLFARSWLRQEETAVEKAFHILTLLGLDHMWDRLAEELSGGQLKLLELGKALMTDAETILADEPVGSVNPVLAHELFEHMVNLTQQLGITFIVIEHRLQIAVEYVDHVYAMMEGQIISEGTPKEVLNDPKVIEGYLR